MPSKRGKKSRRNGSKGSNRSSRGSSASEGELEPDATITGLEQSTEQSQLTMPPNEESAIDVPEAVQEASAVAESVEDVEEVIDSMIPPPPVQDSNVTEVGEQGDVAQVEEGEPVEDTPIVISVEIEPINTSPAKEDVVLDAAAASPFLTPSGVKSSIVADGTTQQSEFVLSPGTEGDEQDAKTAAGVEDLLRQSVDLATMPLGTPQNPNILSEKSSPRSAGPVATSADGQVTVTVEAEPFEQSASSPRTDRSGSLPVSATSPLAYPQSPAPGLLPPIPTPKVSSTASSTVVLTANQTIVLPTTPSQGALSVSLTANGEATNAQASFVTMITDIVSPAKSIALEPGTGPMRFQTPPRAQGLDSLALQTDATLFQSLATTAIAPISIMTDSFAPTIASFHPISFEEAMVALSGTSGKSWRMSVPLEDGRPSLSLLSTVCRCFGASSKPALAPQLSPDDEVQTMLSNTQFDPTVNSHRRILQTIYVYFTGDERTNLAMVGPHWKSIGFISLDPSSELSSVFYLVCILFLIEEFGIDAKRVFKSSIEQGWSFLAVCIPLAGFACKAATSGALNSAYNSTGQVVPITCKLFVGMVKLLAETCRKTDEIEVFNQSLSRKCEKPAHTSEILDAAER